jgi:CRP/FNR family cyclic AMP-dependent transcriptional regulator
VASMSEEAKRTALAGIDFFRGLSEKELIDIARLSEERSFALGDELCHESDFGRLVFVLLEGEADVTVAGDSVGTARPGDVVGELAMLGSGHRTATLTATTPMTVLVLEPEEIDSVLAADPSSASRLGRRAIDETKG